MLNSLTYTEILKKNFNFYIKSLNLKKLTKLFLHSLAFRCILYVIALLIPNHYQIICYAILTYLIILKPYVNSKGVIKVFFSNVVFIFYTIITIFTL